MKEKEQEFKVPESLNAPWLTRQYVMENAWHPVRDEDLNNTPAGKQYYESEFGCVPWKSRSEFRLGDIIIFRSYSNNGDRFLKVTDELMEAYQKGEIEMLPVGVVVHFPISKEEKEYLEKALKNLPGFKKKMDEVMKLDEIIRKGRKGR